MYYVMQCTEASDSVAWPLSYLYVHFTRGYLPGTAEGQKIGGTTYMAKFMFSGFGFWFLIEEIQYHDGLRSRELGQASILLFVKSCSLGGELGSVAGPVIQANGTIE